MRTFFVKDLLQLTVSSLTLFLMRHRCFVILTFPKNISLCFHTAISLDVELKMNVPIFLLKKRLMHVQFMSLFQEDLKKPQTCGTKLILSVSVYWLTPNVAFSFKMTVWFFSRNSVSSTFVSHKHIFNPAEHLRWSFFCKTYFSKKIPS